MKILQILPELNQGGVERGTVDLARELVRRGHESHVLSAGGRMVAQLEAEGSVHHCLPVHRKRLGSLRHVRSLRKLLRDLRPDIVHVRSRLPAWLTWLAWRRLPVSARPRLVTTVHGTYSVNAYSAVMTRGERVIVISNAVKDYVLQNYPGVAADKLQLIYRGVDLELFPKGFSADDQWLTAFFLQYPHLKDKKLLLMPGRITRWKGQSSFVELIGALAQQYPDIHGVMVGDYEQNRAGYWQELQTDIGGKGLQDKISCLGFRDDLREIYSISTLVFNLSTHAEPFGRTVPEALACGAQVVAWNRGGPREVLLECFPQGLVEPDSLPALVEKVRWLLENPQQPQYPEQFSLQRMADQNIVLYQELVNSPRDQTQ